MDRVMCISKSVKRRRSPINNIANSMGLMMRKEMQMQNVFVFADIGRYGGK